MSSSPHSLIDELAWRGLIADSTDLEELRKHLEAAPRRFYIGFDPTAPSLTIGNLLAISLIIRGARAGLGAVVVFGGGTGLIGDPSGKSEERSLLRIEEVEQNAARHQALMSTVFSRALRSDQMPIYVNNAEWLTKLNAISFLRDVGKHFSVSEMIRRDSVRRRLEDPRVGLTYTEFSYSLLQSYDFMRLCTDYDVTLQMGASDQWGNIVAGIDYVRRVVGRSVFGLTCPLLLRSDGTKFGKTEKGAIWISADRTSPYTLYQFLINLDDEEARRFVLFFSLEDRPFIEQLFAEHGQSPDRRALQRHIAKEITTLLHGEEACRKAVAASEELFAGNVQAIDPAMLSDVFADVPAADFALSSLEGEGLSAVDLLVTTGLATSKRNAREHLSNRAVLINGKQAGLDTKVTRQDLLRDSTMFVRRGKKQWHIARFR